MTAVRQFMDRQVYQRRDSEVGGNESKDYYGNQSACDYNGYPLDGKVRVKPS